LPNLRSKFLYLRRCLLKRLVPEFIWPAQVQIDGVEFKLAGTPYSFAVKRLLANNPEQYESEERYFLKYLNEADHVLEYGSSIGILTALICEQVTRGKVVSVEASKDLVAYSSTWLNKYQHLTLVHAAAFPLYHSIPVKLAFDDSSGSLGGLIDYSSTTPDPKINAFFIEDAMAIEGFNPTVLMMDIEGTEKCVLEVSAKFPVSLKKLIFELHPYIYGEQTTKDIVNNIIQQEFALIERRGDVYYFERQST